MHPMEEEEVRGGLKDRENGRPKSDLVYHPLSEATVSVTGQLGGGRASKCGIKLPLPSPPQHPPPPLIVRSGKFMWIELPSLSLPPSLRAPLSLPYDTQVAYPSSGLTLHGGSSSRKASWGRICSLYPLTLCGAVVIPCLHR